MRSRRLARCVRCRSTCNACLCDVLAPIAIRSDVRVLVHHFEAWKTTNTGRLAALALGARYELWGHPTVPPPAMPEGRVLLLFPSDDARPLRPEDAAGAPTLIVPDGTWPQARKIARRVHEACGDRVVRVRVEPDAASTYRFRRSARADALSTFEAIALAVAVLEGDAGPAVLRETTRLFDTFVERQARASQRLG